MSATLDKDAAWLMEHCRKAGKHLVSFARDQIGLDIEMLDCGRDCDGSFSADSADEDDLKRWRDVLFSCYSIETMLNVKAPPREYERLIASAQDWLLPGLRQDEATSAKPEGEG